MRLRREMSLSHSRQKNMCHGVACECVSACVCVSVSPYGVPVCLCVRYRLARQNDRFSHSQTVIFEWFEYVSHSNAVSCFSVTTTLWTKMNRLMVKNKNVAISRNPLNAEVETLVTRSTGIPAADSCFRSPKRLISNVCIFMFFAATSEGTKGPIPQ